MSRVNRFHAVVAHLEQDLVAGAAPEGQQAGLPEVGEIDQDARAEAEPADAPSRLLLDDAADRERPAADQDAIADADAELRRAAPARTSAPKFRSRACEYGVPPCRASVP